MGKWFLALPVWSHFRAFFDARLVRTSPLTPGRSYIMCAHPHGVYSLGTFANWTANAGPGKGLEMLFPGVKVHACTLPVNFRMPGWRELLLSMGIVGCERKALEGVLATDNKKEDNTKTLLILTGGAEEYLHMEPGTMDLVLLKRKGFARLSLATGAPLVPMLTFGENDLFVRVDTPLSRSLVALTNWIGRFAFPCFVGDNGGLLPFRRRLVTVVGRPIEFLEGELRGDGEGEGAEVTREMVDKLHG
ncbi:diacylglycerol O-acyltransferase 1, partial [Irineochytrium annulatum]